MKRSLGIPRAWMAALTFGLCVCAWAQDSSPSLGDVARDARKEHLSSNHTATKQLTNEEEGGPDSSGVWRARMCTESQIPCYELSITLPKTPKWSRTADPPRPVLIPVPGEENDAAHSIRVYAAEFVGPMYLVDVAKRTFLQSWFARPEYFGQAARLQRDERVKIDNYDATITHFTVLSGAAKYRGLSVISATPYGNYGFACAFREEDANAASICDAVIKSARIQTLQPRRLTAYPTYSPQPVDPPDDPPDDDDRQ
jgi:hypothetical protein